MAPASRRIALFGGTFDPPHNGHLAIIRALVRRPEIDEVLLIPAPSPPHKGQRVTPFRHRLAMLEAMVAGMDRVAISLIEAERTTPSFTIDTVRELRERLGLDDRLLLVIGADSFVELHHWRDHAALLAEVDLLVQHRPQVNAEAVAVQAERLGYGKDGGSRWRQARRALTYLSEPALAVSSSAIRSAAQKGQDIKDLVPQAVAAYIHRHHLYPSQRPL